MFNKPYPLYPIFIYAACCTLFPRDTLHDSRDTNMLIMCFGHLYFDFFNKSVKSVKSAVRNPYRESRIRQMNFFMQNEPNFHQNRAIISYGKTKDYENEPPFLA